MFNISLLQRCKENLETLENNPAFKISGRQEELR